MPDRASRWIVPLVVVPVLSACAAGDGQAGASPPPVITAPSATLVESRDDEAARLTARFLEVLDAPDLTYRTVQTTTVVIGEITATQVITSEVVGPDVHLDIVVRRQGNTSHSEVAVVDGVSYARSGIAAWRLAGDPKDVAAVGRSFSFLEGRDLLKYLGRELQAGSFVHHLALRGPIEIDQSVLDMLAMGSGVGTVQELNLYLQQDGTPVSFQIGLTFQVDTGATTGPTDVVAQVIEEYSEVGGEVVLGIPGLT
jgi:hypothetical protein